MFMHKVICGVLEYAFQIPILHFAQVIEDNLAKEINFNIEAENAKRCKENFIKIKNDSVYVPNIIDEFTC